MDTTTTMDHAQNAPLPLTTCYSLNKSLLHPNLCSSARAPLSAVSHGAPLLFTRLMPSTQKLALISQHTTKRLSTAELVHSIVNSWTMGQFSLLQLALVDTFCHWSPAPQMPTNAPFAVVSLKIHFFAKRTIRSDTIHIFAHLERKWELLTQILTISKWILKTTRQRTVRMMHKLILTIPITGANWTQENARLWLLWFKMGRVSLSVSAHPASKIKIFQLKTDSSSRISSLLRIQLLVWDAQISTKMLSPAMFMTEHSSLTLARALTIWILTPMLTILQLILAKHVHLLVLPAVMLQLAHHAHLHIT